MDNTKDIRFSISQLEYLKRTFPRVTFGPDATHAEMLWHSGAQAVIDMIQKRTYNNVESAIRTIQTT